MSRQIPDELKQKALTMLETEDIDTVAATSHFYADEQSPKRFLERRAHAYETLRAALPEDAPTIRLGAEVLYYPGVSRMEELPLLCLEGTELLMLEMPFDRWSDYMVQELRELAYSGRFQLMLAHVERSYAPQPLSVWDSLLEQGVLMQSNAEFFLPLRCRRTALRMLAEGRIHLLGSDCHNNTSRAPRMGEAFERIRKKLGEDALREIDGLGRHLLTGGRL